MKKRNYIIMILLSTWICFGCQDYLSVNPANIRSVETVEDVRGILGGYLLSVKNPAYGMNARGDDPYAANWYGISFFPNGDLLRMFYYYDNSVDASTYLSKKTGNGQQQFFLEGVEWQMEWLHESIWNNAYMTIGFMNHVLSELDHVTGDAQEKQRLSGEAKVLRCWHIFKLLQYFSPYQDENLGIPLNLDREDVMACSGKRLKQTEIYQIILSGLTEVLNEKAPSNPNYNVFYNKEVIHAFMAQIYQYKADGPAQEVSDWKNAREHAMAAMDRMKLATTPEGLNSLFKASQINCSMDNPHALLTFFWEGKDNNGIYGDCCMQWGYPQYWESWNDPASSGFQMDPELLRLYSETDIRVQDGVYVYNRKYMEIGKYIQSAWDIRDIYSMFRAADMHLIVAESYVRDGDEGNAKIWLNNFKTSRKAGGWASSDTLEEILNERRKEFAVEYDYRWLDMKRYGMSLTRKYNHPQKGETIVTLEKNDYRYSFYIPESSELGLNKDLEQNPGW